MWKPPTAKTKSGNNAKILDDDLSAYYILNAKISTRFSYMGMPQPLCIRTHTHTYTAGRHASVYKNMFNIKVTLGNPNKGTCSQVSHIIGLLQAPGRTCMYQGFQRSRKVCLKLILQVTPLDAGELKVLKGIHGTNPMKLLEGEVGLEKHTFIKKCPVLHGNQ